MSKKFKIVLTAFILCMIFAVLVACDSTSGKSDTVYLNSFRSQNEQLILPIPVTRATSGPTNSRLFKSKLSLDEIYDGIVSGTDYEAERGEGYIVVADVGGESPVYIYIAPYDDESGRFNYFATNMGFNLNDPKAGDPYRNALVPLLLIGVPAYSNEILTGEEYPLSGTKEEVKNFYASNGYAVTETENSLEITDVTGKTYSDGTVSFDDLAVEFIITFTSGGAIYTLPETADNDEQNSNAEVSR